MIQRRKGYGKREPLRDAHKIYIVCVENVEIMTNVFLSQKWGTFLGKRDVMFLFFFFFVHKCIYTFYDAVCWW